MIESQSRSLTTAYVNRRGPRRKGVNMDVILSSLSLMAASLLALVRGIAISIIIMQAVIAAVLWQGSIPSFRRLLPMASCFTLPLRSKSLLAASTTSALLSSVSLSSETP